MSTKTQKRLEAVLEELMKSGSRAGVLLLSYVDSDGEERLARGMAMADRSVNSAVGAVFMIRALRELADELEAVVEGKKPLSVLQRSDPKKGPG